MRSYLNKITLSMIMLLSAFYTQAAQPVTPLLTVNTQGLKVTLNWSATLDASGYRLFYAPYPYQGEHSIGSFDLGEATNFSIELWQQAAYYVAVKSYDTSNQSSEYSNIGFVQIQDRGEHYRQFWETTIKEINDKQFVSDDYLYFQLPNTETCFEGVINEQVTNREVETLNQIRKLHNLSAVQYDETGNSETQNAALIQKANNFLSHTPPQDAECYSKAGFDGSNSSNLGLATENQDPANDLISLIDDAFNISAIGSVGHRRHLLNPFLQFTSYGQVHGASAVKVFDFFDSTTALPAESPEFIAFPYLRYPYVFLSDKNTDKKTPWSLSIIEKSDSAEINQHDYFSNAKVTITQKNDNHELIVHDVFSDTNDTGIPNNLSWMVDNWEYDTWYTVLIENISYQSGQSSKIEYDVFIDYKNFFNTMFPLETGDTQENSNLIQGTLLNTEDKDSFEITLNGHVSFSGSSQFSNTAFFIEVYNADKQLLQASDNPFSLDLPNSQYTLVITNCHSLSCYSDKKEYRVQIENN